jgi:hypothetical protein
MMRWRHLLVGIAALAAAGAPGLGQGLEAENLLTGLPEGFELGSQVREGVMDMSEFVPVGETVRDWTRLITIQVFKGEGDAPIQLFAESLQQGWNSACADASNARLAEGFVNGYPYADWRFICPLSPHTDKPEAMWMRAVSGNDAFYVVQYAYRVAPTPEREAEARTYLEGVSVCDTRLAEHACPSGM